MAKFAKIEGIDRLVTRLRKMAKDAKNANQSVVVGFSQRYAIYVHEDLTAYHKVGKAKFLESNARRMRKRLGKMIAKVFKKTKNMKQALLTGGYALLRPAQKDCPVDTSALRASGYVALERDYKRRAAEAFAKSEQIRLSRPKKTRRRKKRR